MKETVVGTGLKLSLDVSDSGWLERDEGVVGECPNPNSLRRCHGSKVDESEFIYGVTKNCCCIYTFQFKLSVGNILPLKPF